MQNKICYRYKYREKKISDDHNDFINQIKKIHNIMNLSSQQNNFYIFEYKNKENAAEKILKYIKNIISSSKNDHICCQVSSIEHMMAIYLQKENNYLKIFFYDPNTNRKDPGFNVRWFEYFSNIENNETNILKEKIKFELEESNYFSNNNPSYLCIYTYIKEDFHSNKFRDDFNLKDTDHHFKNGKKIHY